MEYVQLLGAEQVERSASTIRQASNGMQDAAQLLVECAAVRVPQLLDRLQTMLDAHAARIEAALTMYAERVEHSINERQS